MKTLFFSQNTSKVEQMALALKIRWPDLNPLVASKGIVGLDILEHEEPDITILCEDLPDIGMFPLIKEIRRFSDIPLIVVSEDDDEMMGIKALDHGADDFISSKASLMVMMVKVVALLRRVNMADRRGDEPPIYCGELLINPATFEVYLGSKALRLTPTEFRMLYLLAKNRHITLSQDFIINAIWADDYEGGNKVKKYIQRLRRKLNDDARNPKWIKTVHGLGYRLSPQSDEHVLVGASNAA